MLDKVKRLIELKNLIDWYKKEFDSIKKELEQDENFKETLKVDWYSISRYVKTTYKLKDKDDEAILMMEHPNCAKSKFDIEAFLKEDFEKAQRFVEVKETGVVTVRKDK